MSGNVDGDNNDQYESSTGQNPALMRSNKDQGASGSWSSPKREPLTNKNKEEAKKKTKHSKKHRRYSSTSSSSASESHSPERKRKKASKKRRKHRCKKSSSSSSESDTETDFDTEPFKVISGANKYKYNLPTMTANYANE